MAPARLAAPTLRVDGAARPVRDDTAARGLGWVRVDAAARPGRRVRARVALPALLALVLASRPAGAEPDVRLPPGTRTDAQGQLVSGRGLRDTSDFLARELTRRGIAVDQIGPYGVRGVELTRFVSQTPSTPWLAIHVLRTGGKTLIFFVPRPKASTTP